MLVDEFGLVPLGGRVRPTQRTAPSEGTQNPLVQRDTYNNEDGGGDYAGIKSSLGFTESGGNYDASNPWGFTGKYQFGKPRFSELAGDYTWDQYVNNPAIQEIIMDRHLADIDRFIDSNNLSIYEGTTVGGAPIDRNSMYAMAHLGGKGGMRRYLESGGSYNPSDAYGTSLQDYAKSHNSSTNFADRQGEEVADIQNDIINSREELNNFENTVAMQFATPQEQQRMEAIEPFSPPVNTKTIQGTPYQTASLDPNAAFQEFIRQTTPDGAGASQVDESSIDDIMASITPDLLADVNRAISTTSGDPRDTWGGPGPAPLDYTPLVEGDPRDTWQSHPPAEYTPLPSTEATVSTSGDGSSGGGGGGGGGGGSSTPSEGKDEDEMKNPSWQNRMEALGLGLSQLSANQVINPGAVWDRNRQSFTAETARMGARSTQAAEARLTEEQDMKRAALARDQRGRAWLANHAAEKGYGRAATEAIYNDAETAKQYAQSLFPDASSGSSVTDQQRALAHYENEEIRQGVAEVAKADGWSQAKIDNILNSPYAAMEAEKQLNKSYASDRERGRPIVSPEAQEAALDNLYDRLAIMEPDDPRKQILDNAIMDYQQELAKDDPDPQTLGDIMQYATKDLRGTTVTSAETDIEVAGQQAVAKVKQRYDLEKLDKGLENDLKKLAAKDGYDQEAFTRTVDEAMRQEEQKAKESDRVMDREAALKRAEKAYDQELNVANNKRAIDSFFGENISNDPVTQKMHQELTALAELGGPMDANTITDHVKGRLQEAVEAAEREEQNRSTNALLSAAKRIEDEAPIAADLMRSGKAADAIDMYKMETGRDMPEQLKILDAMRKDPALMELHTEIELAEAGKLTAGEQLAYDSVKEELTQRAKESVTNEKAASAAREVQRIIAQNPDARSGGVIGLLAPYAGYFKNIGIDVTGDLPMTQVLDALMVDMARNRRIPGEGAASNYDQELYQRSGPMMKNTRLGNLMIAQITAGKLERSSWYNDKMREWYSKDHENRSDMFIKEDRDAWIKEQADSSGLFRQSVPSIDYMEGMPTAVKLDEDISRADRDNPPNTLIELRQPGGVSWYYVTGQDGDRVIYDQDGDPIE